jgi:hypothetical protein
VFKRIKAIKTQRFGDWTVYRFYSFEHWTMDRVQKPNNHRFVVFVYILLKTIFEDVRPRVTEG